MKQAIVANSNIKETLDTHPELKQVLISLSPKFKRMQNVAVYNTLARFANFNDAAKITGLSVCEILHTINRHLGTEDVLMQDVPQCISVDAFGVEEHSVEIEWDENTDRFIYSEKSMSRLITKVIELEPQKNMVVIAVELPGELLKVAHGLGHSYNIEKGKEYRISIYNPLPGIKKRSWLEHKNKYDILDVRTLGENPFDAILHKAEMIADGDGFVLIQTFEPLPMINMLAAKGFEYLSEQTAEDEYRIYFHKTTRTDQENMR